jgi:hypothetical protein
MTIHALGTTPAGLGTQVANGPLYAASLWQKSSTGAVSSVAIDPVEMDTTHDAYGSENGMSDTGQRILILCKLSLGSRANWPTQGLRTPDKCGADLERYVTDAFTQALAPVVDDGSARIDSITVETDANFPTRGYALVTWYDLKRQNANVTTKIPLQF